MGEKFTLNMDRKYQEETTNLDANKLASEDKDAANKMNFSWIYHKEEKEKPAGIVLLE